MGRCGGGWPVLLVLAVLLGGGRPAVAGEREEAAAAEKNVRAEIDLAFDKIVRKRRKKCRGDYNFLRAIVCWNAARAARRDEAWTIAQVLFNEAHEQLTLFFRRNGKKLRQESVDKARDRSAEKAEKKMRIALYDTYLERMEAVVPRFLDFAAAKAWTDVEGAVQGDSAAEEEGEGDAR